MINLLFATHNENKVKEASSVLSNQFKILSLHEIGYDKDIPEPFFTLKENAIQKAQVVRNETGIDCFAEDTGLEVNVLNGEPGARSARYAGDGHNFQANIDKLLLKMHDLKDRSARFATVICLLWHGKQYLFEGECKGSILTERRGEKGFGYDSVFIPEGSVRTFGEMELSEKNKYSHRKKAMGKLINFLTKLPSEEELKQKNIE